MAAVSLLEANWISFQEIFELVNRVLTQIFVGLWPKQKAEVPNNDVKKLAQAFDTTEDPFFGLLYRFGDGVLDRRLPLPC
jgi:hypothetical protein